MSRHRADGRGYGIIQSPQDKNQFAEEFEVREKEDEGITLLQYVDDLLIATRTEAGCMERTLSLVNFLGQASYRVSKKKAQTAEEHVTYLRFTISRWQQSLGTERKEVICQTPEPRSVCKLWTFLGMGGWCGLWIPNSGLWVKPLYEALRNPKEMLHQGGAAVDSRMPKAFRDSKRAVMSALHRNYLTWPNLVSCSWMLTPCAMGVSSEVGDMEKGHRIFFQTTGQCQLRDILAAFDL